MGIKQQRADSGNTSIRWIYLAIGVICMLFAGIIYAWSILKAPFGKEFGWTASQLALNFSLTMCFFCIGGIVSGLLTKRTSAKVTLFIGAILVCSGFVLVSRMSNNIIMLYITYGGLCGLGIGMAYNAIISTVGAWFPDKKGTCSGLLMMGFGASALILGSLASSMIQSESIGWRNTYMILGIAMGAVLLVTGLVLRAPTMGAKLPLPKQIAKTKTEEMIVSKDYTTLEMVKRFTFWRFFLFTTTMAAIGSTVISFAKDLSVSVGASAALATTLVGVLSVCNGLGRIMCGVIFDNFGRRKTMLFANALTILAPMVLLTAIHYKTMPLFVIGLCLTGLSYGCSPTISSAFISTFYGTKNFALNFSVANSMLIPASFIATLSAGLLTSTGSYVVPFIMLICLSLVGLGLNLSIKQP